MPRRPKTAFDRYVSAQMRDAEFAKELASSRAEVDFVDRIVRALDERRVAIGLSKAELAKRVGMKAELIRRLFTASEPNPTLDTVARLAVALECRLDLEPLQGRRVRKLAARVARR